MSRKINHHSSTDFTINDYANSSKPTSRVRKSAVTIQEAESPDLAWDEIDDANFDLLEDTSDGTKKIVFCRKKKPPKECDTAHRPGLVYPEIVWYLISWYIKPEEIYNFAGINKATYSITKRESFWRNIYNHYCKNHPKLPERLSLETSFQSYGLQQRVIRGLFHTYDVFVKRIAQKAALDSRPHDLIKRRCINVWYCKSTGYWCVYFKFKKTYPEERTRRLLSFLDELGRIDANPDEDTQVLEVLCRDLCHTPPPLMGTTLCSVSMVLSQGFRHHKLHLGFTTGPFSKQAVPDCAFTLDTVVNVAIYDWWHPKYPHYELKIPEYMKDDESIPVLKRNFFKTIDDL